MRNKEGREREKEHQTSSLSLLINWVPDYGDIINESDLRRQHRITHTHWRHPCSLINEEKIVIISIKFRLKCHLIKNEVSKRIAI